MQYGCVLPVYHEFRKMAEKIVAISSYLLACKPRVRVGFIGVRRRGGEILEF